MFMTALLMRCQVIPANFVIFFVIDLIFWNPSGSYATEGNNNNNSHIFVHAVIQSVK